MRAALRATTMTLAMLGLALMGTRAQMPAPAPSLQAAPALVALLEARGLQTFAAPEPGAAGRFVAVMYIKGTELLVVSAKYPVPELLHARLDAGRYLDAYMDLQGASLVAGRWFIEDLEADGLRVMRAANEPFDVVFRDDASYVVLDGNWQRQSITEPEYRQRYSAAEEQYARMLAALVAALRAQS
jgi:hypothetical protein